MQVRSFAKEQASTDRYGGAQDRVVDWGLRSARASGFFFGFNSVIGTGSIVFVLWYGARQVSISFPAHTISWLSAHHIPCPRLSGLAEITFCAVAPCCMPKLGARQIRLNILKVIAVAMPIGEPLSIIEF